MVKYGFQKMPILVNFLDLFFQFDLYASIYGSYECM